MTHVTESIVTGERLRELGLEPPAPDVPWKEEPPHADGEVWRRADQPNPDLEAAREYWKQRCGAMDSRLRAQLAQWVREFGLASVREAIDIVAVNMSRGTLNHRYLMLVRVFREIRKRKDGARGPSE